MKDGAGRSASALALAGDVVCPRTANNANVRVMRDYFWSIAERMHGIERFSMAMDASSRSKEDVIMMAVRGIRVSGEAVSAWAPPQVGRQAFFVGRQFQYRLAFFGGGKGG